MELETFDYLQQIIPDAKEPCAACGRQVEVCKALVRDQKLFCSENCADRALALLIKPQPSGLRLDGIDV